MTTDSTDKIRLKGGPKQYKRGPGAVGRKRFEQRVAKLMIDLARFARRDTTDDARWALAWLAELQTIRERVQRP